ncbi:hypothetical protein GCM10009839_37070 [Catenulispora yoronensis]|uniref:Uncharacterized protein n=1 Tax=Catenulispora yoronensis TaxID=450799 RepID=A0ABN2UD65_9ACTN
MAGFDPSPIRRLVELICTDPDLRVVTEDGRIARPVQPPVFESLPHAEKVCQAAVKVVEDGTGTVFNVSLCDLSVFRVEAPPAPECSRPRAAPARKLVRQSA